MPITLGGSNTVGATCPNLGGEPLCHASDPYRADISAAAVHPDSAAMIALMCEDDAGDPWPDTLSALLHPTDYGFPFVVVPEAQALVTVAYDPTYGFPEYGLAQAPIPASFPLEGTTAGAATPTAFPNDQHGIVVVRDDAGAGGVKWVYEMYSVHKPTGGSPWTVSRLCWRYAGDSLYSDRIEGFPTTTAAATRILPALITYEDVHTRGVIDHALRMTLLSLSPTHVPPARAQATGSADRAPQGVRLRLKASVNISGYSAGAQVILQALKTYGVFVDDTGPNFQLQGTRDARWAAYEFNDELDGIVATDFEVLNYSPGYTLTEPTLYGAAGVESGPFTFVLAAPTANVGVGDVLAAPAGCVMQDTFVGGGPAGGTWKVDGTPNYRVTLDSTATSATVTYTPASGLADGTQITTRWYDNTLGRVEPGRTVFTIGEAPPEGPGSRSAAAALVCSSATLSAVATSRGPRATRILMFSQFG